MDIMIVIFFCGAKPLRGDILELLSGSQRPCRMPLSPHPMEAAATSTSRKSTFRLFPLHRGLIIRITAEACRCILVAGHAPHSGQPLEEIEQWWIAVGTAVPSAYREWPVLLLVDANAAVGATPSDAIDDHHSEPPNPKSEPFENVVHAQGPWLPATFDTCQSNPGHTWVHSNGKQKRIDYVGFPIAWTPVSCCAWVSSLIDPSITRTDHLAACAELHFQGVSTSTKRRARFRQLCCDLDIGTD